ncbi:polysaccharide lyase family 8 super-sandwich domain-containing protein [Streptomyces avicenniae]|uniref:polysaccharide lyase family 8 super-sandwich domain-containing protein n=1 Tax=Streptomyces avicenniae TaxID=500153 RepID=UPI00069BACB1|nr:polysaccharide lyase family 8 super-sandwich domain-containing protein [Streptomyces avicenniae]
MRRRTVLAGGLGLAAGTGLGSGASARARTGGDGDTYGELLARWRAVLVGPGAPQGPYADAYARAVAAHDAVAAGRLAGLVIDEDAPSPWPDLPLDETPALSANVTAAADRLRSLALATATPGGQWYGNADAAARTASGCRVLWRARYHAGQAQYGNWWDWEIGTPRALTDALALLGPATDAATAAGLLAAVDHFVPDPRRMLRGELESTGANRVDLCRVVAVRGALGGDDGRLTSAAAALSGVLDPVPLGDGFHADGSFLMHTSVAYPGTYGEVLLRGMAELMRLLAGTAWDVGAPERRLTAEAVDRTFVPLTHHGLTLDAVRGRAIARHTATDADDGFRLALDLLLLADALPPPEAARLRATAKYALAHNTWRDLAVRSPAQVATAATVLGDDSVVPADGPLGHFGYDGMERYVHRRPGWTYCLSLNSDRVARYEYMNGENAHGWHTGDGASLLYVDGEGADPYPYTDAYWPTCDPKRLAGITVDTAPLPVGAGGDNDHVPLSGTRWSGSVRLGDTALAGCDLRGTDSPLRARRSWLFLDDAVLTAGSGITATGGRRVESVVQHRQRPGAFTVDGAAQPDTPGVTRAHPGARWAHLAGTGGHVFLHTAASCRLRSLREDREGAWADIRQGGPTARLTRRYLTLWHDHGEEPADAAFADLLLPGATAATTAARAAAPGVEVLRLDREAHAFRAGQVTAAVFFTAGSAAGITADGPCAVLLAEDAAGTLRVAVADPSRSVPAVTLRIADGRRTLAADPGLTVLATGRGGLRLHAATGGTRGAGLTAAFSATGTPARPARLTSLPPDADATVRGGAHAGLNDGRGDVLTVRRAAAADDTRRAYLRFRLPGGARPERAVLWVYGAIPKDPDSRASDLLHHPLRAHATAPGARWGERRLTWDTAPAPAAPLGEGLLTTYPDWTGLDVTGAVRDAAARGEAYVTLALAQDDEGPEMRLDSRESGGRTPRLHVLTR